MTGDEHQAQEVVADVIVDRGIEVWLGHLLRLKLATEFLVLALHASVSADVIDCTMLGGGHEPGARVGRDARLRPLLQRGDESILRKVLGQTDIADDPRQPGNEPRGLNPPDCIDGAMCVGSRHTATDHNIFIAPAQAGRSAL